VRGFPVRQSGQVRKQAATTIKQVPGSGLASLFASTATIAV
jgi:hypothetical protein